MEHTEAVRLHAAEKYLLGELSSAQRDAYEEHYFDCPTCAEEIKTTVAFMESAKQVVRERAPQAVDEKQRADARIGWFAWLRPAFAVPALAALILLAGYEGVTISRLRNAPAQVPAQIMTASVQLLGGVRGGSEGIDAAPRVQVRAGEGFLLNFDFTPSRSFSAYRWQLQDATGAVVREDVIAGDNANQAMHLPVSGGVQKPGKYSLVFFGLAGGDQSTSGTEVLRLRFAVEFKQ